MPLGLCDIGWPPALAPAGRPPPPVQTVVWACMCMRKACEGVAPVCNALRCRNPAPNSRTSPHPHPPRCSAQSRCATEWRARRWPRPSVRTWAGRWSQARRWPARRRGMEWRGLAWGANTWHGVERCGTERCPRLSGGNRSCKTRPGLTRRIRAKQGGLKRRAELVLQTKSCCCATHLQVAGGLRLELEPGAAALLRACAMDGLFISRLVV